MKAHFDSSEQLRLDTFQTVEALKGEFMGLREELRTAENTQNPDGKVIIQKGTTKALGEPFPEFGKPKGPGR